MLPGGPLGGAHEEWGGPADEDLHGHAGLEPVEHRSDNAGRQHALGVSLRRKDERVAQRAAGMGRIKVLAQVLA